MTRVRRRNYSKLTRNIKRIPTCFLHVCSNDPLESLQQRNKPGAFRRRTTTSRSRVGPRERLDPLCKQGKPYPSATSACRSSAEALILTLAVRRAPGTRSTPDSSCSWWHCGRRWCTLAQLKTASRQGIPYVRWRGQPEEFVLTTPNWKKWPGTRSGSPR